MSAKPTVPPAMERAGANSKLYGRRKQTIPFKSLEERFMPVGSMRLLGG